MYVHKPIAEYKKGDDLNEANMPKQESLLKLKVQQKSTSPVCDRVPNGLSQNGSKKEKRSEQKKRKEEKTR